MRARSRFAEAVMPSPHLRRNPQVWELLGLPRSGWVVLFDLLLCDTCSGQQERPCATSCATAHALPPPDTAATAALPDRVCVQCLDAPCARACPVDAVTHTPQGVVVIDQELCIGCRFCLDVCPVGSLTHVDPFAVEPAGQRLPDYDPLRPDGRLGGTVAKCTLCSDRLLAGELPVCAAACPHGAIYVGNLDRNTVTNGQVLDRLDALLWRRPHVVRQRVPGAGARLVALL